MKGYCPNCNKVVDETQFDLKAQVCDDCFMKGYSIKHKNLRIRKGTSDFYYTCKTLKWNYWLNRFYPKAELVMEVEYLNNGLGIVKA